MSDSFQDLSPEELAEYARLAGIDLNHYTPVGNQLVPKTAKTVDPNESIKPSSSAGGAFGRSAATQTAPVLVGSLAALGTGAALSSTGVGLPAGIPLILGSLAGLGAAYGTSKIQEPLLTDKFKQQLAEDTAQH